MPFFRVNGLESAKLKIARAAVHLDEINHLIGEATRKTDTHEVIKDANSEETINFLIGPPRDVIVIVGEIVDQIRSALDHLAFQLVESNPSGVKLPKNWETDCSFPMMLTIPTFGKPDVPYSLPVPQKVFDKTLPGLSKEAYAFIEGVQPYRRGQGAGLPNVMKIIAKLSNIDKHRHLHVLIRRSAVHHHVTHASGTKSVSTVGGLKHGAKIPLPNEISDDPAVNVNRSFSHYVTFDETIGSGPAALESQNVLQVCLEQIEKLVIPAFEKFLQKP